MSSDGSTSLTNCICQAGYFGSSSSCSVCPQGYFCDGDGTKKACPLNSIAPPGATKLAECECTRGWYPEVSLPRDACIIP
ncbi:MAG: hypothetical protein ACK56I_37385, partial [bacterium]